MNASNRKSLSQDIEPETTPAKEGNKEAAPSVTTTADNSALGVFSIPSKKYYHSTTGMVQGTARREPDQGRFGPGSSKISYTVQSPNGPTTMLFMAEKKGHKYAIYDASDKKKLLGTLSKVRTSAQGIAYTLTRVGVEVACIAYKVASPLSYMTDGAARNAQVAISSSHLQVDKTEGGPTLQELCMASYCLHKTFRQIDDPFVSAFETKKPYDKGDGRLGLNFHGRGKKASNKNLQLKGENGKIALQMAKWEKHHYNVDFKAPFNAFQAFGFALAQLDL